MLSEISSGRKRWCFRGDDDDDGDDELPPPHENVPADAAAAGGGGRVPELPPSKQGRAKLLGQYVCMLEMPYVVPIKYAMHPKMPSPRLECTRACIGTSRICLILQVCTPFPLYFIVGSDVASPITCSHELRVRESVSESVLYLHHLLCHCVRWPPRHCCGARRRNASRSALDLISSQTASRR